MGFPENSLARDERVIVHSHSHWKIVLVPTLLFLLVTGVAGVASGFAATRSLEGGARTAVLGAVWLIWLGLVVWLFAVPFVKWLSTHFVVTDRRVMFQTGIVSRSGIEIALNRINSVEFEQGVVDRVLGCGSLIIESASREPLVFEDVPGVLDVRNLLQHELYPH